MSYTSVCCDDKAIGELYKQDGKQFGRCADCCEMSEFIQ